METFTLIVLAGIVATMTWIVFMFAVSGEGLRHGDMVSSLGSDVTRDPSKFYARGIEIYMISGLVLAPVFYWILSFEGFDSIFSAIAFSALLSICFGFLMMHVFFRWRKQAKITPHLAKFTLSTPMLYWLGYIVYGIALGAMFWSFSAYHWIGFLIVGTSVLCVSTIVSFFVKKGSSAAVLRRQEESQRSDDKAA